MGFPPPPDAPSPGIQAGISASASFAPSPTGISICGFKIPPSFSFNLSFSLSLLLPDFSFPPTFFFALQLKCDLSDPIDADFGFGGGRVGTKDLDTDDELVVG